MVSSTLLNNMMNPTRANAGKSYREGASDALAKRILEAEKIQNAERHKSDMVTAGLNQEGKRFSNSQAPIIAGERTAAHNSNLESAEVGRDATRTQTQKMVQDIAHDKSQRQIKDTFVSIEAASKLPYQEQDIFLENLIEDYDGHGRLGTVFKYMQKADPEGRAKIFKELNDVGVKGGYLDELYSARSSTARPTNLGSYMAYVREDYMKKNDGKEPPAQYMLQAQERFQKISGSQAYERAYGTAGGKTAENVSPEADTERKVIRDDKVNTTADEEYTKQTVKLTDDIYKKVSINNSTIGLLEGIVEDIDNGANTGWAQNHLPDIKASTISLRQKANELALDVIGSVTFGALSEGELRLAQDIALPTTMQPQELRKWVVDRVEARKKLNKYLTEQAEFLTANNPRTGQRNTNSDWIKYQKAEQRKRLSDEDKEADKPKVNKKPMDIEKAKRLYRANPNNLSKEELDRQFDEAYPGVREQMQQEVY